MMIPPPLTNLEDVVVLRGDLIDDGYTDHQIAAAVRVGMLHRIRRGAYCSAQLWRGASEVDRHRITARAVLRTSHPSTVLTHVSAAVEHGAPVWNIALDSVHTTRTDGKGGRREAGKVLHRGRLPVEQVQVVNDVPVCTATRCAIEVTSMTDVESALVTVNGLLHGGKTTPHLLTEMAQDTRFWPETLRTTMVLRLADPRIESVGETRTSHLCWSQRLPKPVPQVVIEESGHEFARVDFAWPELGVFLEFDGREKYERYRRDGETLEDFLLREKRREERICQLTGWVCIRINWADLERPVATGRRLRAVLDSRARASA